MKIQLNKRKIIVLILVTLLILLGGTGIAILNATHKHYDLELGENLNIQDLNRLPIGTIVSNEELEWSELQLGEYTYEVKLFGLNYSVCICVVDTIAPTAESLNLVGNPLMELSPEDCVANPFDLTEISFQFMTEINYEIEDEQEIIVALEDESGNIAEIISTVIIIQDITPPTIEGEDSYRFLLNESIAYRELVTVTDDRDEEIDLQIDNSEVDTSKEGSYKVLYTATDYAGHITEKEVEIVIYKYTEVATTSSSSTNTSSSSSGSSSSSSSSSTSSSQTTQELAQEVLSSIITSGMSQTQKAKAIFTWCYTKISYSSGSSSGWENAARQGLTTKKGGCFTFASTARMLLTEAGIKNMSISSSVHYWNLIDVGSGWYHFDATYCSDKVQIFMYTDEQLTAYYNTGYKARHNYDKSSYPSIN